LVWDWNGTLLDDFALVAAATSTVITGAGGLDVDPDTHRARFRRPIIEYYGELLGRPLTPEEFVKLDEQFHSDYRVRLPGCQLSLGASEALSSWRGTQSLLSMWHHRELVPLVDTFGLTPHFARVDGLRRPSEDSKRPFLVAHLEALSIDGPDCVLIGDSVDDALAAAAVGARCVLYSKGFTARSALEAVGVPVADSLADAIAIASTD